MSQRGKRGNRFDNDQQPPQKRRKGRPPNGGGSNNDLNDHEMSGTTTIPVVSAGVQTSSVSERGTTVGGAGSSTTSTSTIWQARSLSDLKISSIYNRSSSEAPAELFRKDLISAMKLPDSEPLSTDEYWTITDQWKQEWEKGVQVPVNPDSLPEPSVKLLQQPVIPIRHDFKLPKTKYVRITKDDNFDSELHYLSNVPSLAETACAYDLDQTDEVWLHLLNKERALCGAPPITDGQFERVIEELEVRCWDKIQAIMRSEEGLGIEYDENVICDVCRSPDSEEANEMVFCDNCNICVHQACYGITAIPSGQWLCRTCSMGKKPDCALCPNKGGAMKSTKSGKKWAHVSCALWIPEVSIGCVDRMEPITKISSIPQSRWALICVLCRERVGACIQCSVKTCKTAYHVTCAFQHGLEMRAIIEEGNAEDGVKLRSYCLKHSVSKGKKDKCSGKSGTGGAVGEKGGVGSGSEDDDVRRRKMRKDMTSEERNQARVLRLQEVESEFDKHVNIKDISCHLLEVDQEAILCIYNYWILKRKSRNNHALIPPKIEEVDNMLSSTHRQEQQQDLEKRKMVVHLRQDLERVRNLCYMVNRREKLSRSFFKMREQIFYKQIAVLTEMNKKGIGNVSGNTTTSGIATNSSNNNNNNNSCSSSHSGINNDNNQQKQQQQQKHQINDEFIQAVIYANNGPSIYDKFYSSGNFSRDCSNINFDNIQEIIKNSFSNNSNNNSSNSSNSQKLDTDNSSQKKYSTTSITKSLSTYKKIHVNGISSTSSVAGATGNRKSDSVYGDSCLSSNSDDNDDEDDEKSSSSASSSSSSTSSGSDSSERRRQRQQQQKATKKKTHNYTKTSIAATLEKQQQQQQRRRRKTVAAASAPPIVDSSSEDDDGKLSPSKNKNSNSTASSPHRRQRRLSQPAPLPSRNTSSLHQMERELEKESASNMLSSSNESDEIILIKNNSSNKSMMNKKSTVPIYSDSSDTGGGVTDSGDISNRDRGTSNKERIDNVQISSGDSQHQQQFRTKAAMKEFTLQQQQQQQQQSNKLKQHDIKRISPNKLALTSKKESGSVATIGGSLSSRPKNKNSSEIMTTSPTSDKTKTKDKEISHKKNTKLSSSEMVADQQQTKRDGGEKKMKSSQQKQNENNLTSSIAAIQNLENKQRFPTDLLVVPQRQAAKKASENMRSTTYNMNIVAQKKESSKLDEKEISSTLLSSTTIKEKYSREKDKESSKEDDKEKDIREKEREKDTSSSSSSSNKDKAKPRGRPPKTNTKDELKESSLNKDVISSNSGNATITGSQQQQRFDATKSIAISPASEASSPPVADNGSASWKNKTIDNNLLVAYVPQRQAAKKAAQHIKSGLGKSTTSNLEPFQASTDEKDKSSDKDNERSTEKDKCRTSAKEKKSTKSAGSNRQQDQTTEKETKSGNKKEKSQAIVVTSSSSESSSCSSSCSTSTSEESDVEEDGNFSDKATKPKKVTTSSRRQTVESTKSIDTAVSPTKPKQSKSNKNDSRTSSRRTTSTEDSDNRQGDQMIKVDDGDEDFGELCEKETNKSSPLVEEKKVDIKDAIEIKNDSQILNEFVAEEKLVNCEAKTEKVENFDDNKRDVINQESSYDLPKQQSRTLEEEITQRKADQSSLAGPNKTTTTSVMVATNSRNMCSLDKLLDKKEKERKAAAAQEFTSTSMEKPLSNEQSPSSHIDIGEDNNNPNYNDDYHHHLHNQMKNSSIEDSKSSSTQNTTVNKNYTAHSNVTDVISIDSESVEREKVNSNNKSSNNNNNNNTNNNNNSHNDQILNKDSTTLSRFDGDQILKINKQSQLQQDNINNHHHHNQNNFPVDLLNRENEFGVGLMNQASLENDVTEVANSGTNSNNAQILSSQSMKKLSSNDGDMTMFNVMSDSNKTLENNKTISLQSDEQQEQQQQQLSNQQLQKQQQNDLMLLKSSILQQNNSKGDISFANTANAVPSIFEMKQQMNDEDSARETMNLVEKLRQKYKRSSSTNLKSLSSSNDEILPSSNNSQNNSNSNIENKATTPPIVGGMMINEVAPNVTSSIAKNDLMTTTNTQNMQNMKLNLKLDKNQQSQKNIAMVGPTTPTSLMDSTANTDICHSHQSTITSDIVSSTENGSGNHLMSFDENNLLFDKTNSVALHHIPTHQRQQQQQSLAMDNSKSFLSPSPSIDKFDNCKINQIQQQQQQQQKHQTNTGADCFDNLTAATNFFKGDFVDITAAAAAAVTNDKNSLNLNNTSSGMMSGVGVNNAVVGGNGNGSRQSKLGSVIDCDYDDNTRMQSPYMNPNHNIWNENELIQTRRSVSSSPSSISESNDDYSKMKVGSGTGTVGTTVSHQNKQQQHDVQTSQLQHHHHHVQNSVQCDNNVNLQQQKNNFVNNLGSFEMSTTTTGAVSQFQQQLQQQQQQQHHHHHHHQHQHQQHQHHHQTATPHSIVNGVDMLHATQYHQHNFTDNTQYNGPVSLFPPQSISNINVQMPYPSPGAALYPPTLGAAGVSLSQQTSHSSSQQQQQLFSPHIPKHNQSAMNLQAGAGSGIPNDTSAFSLLGQPCNTGAAFTSSSHNLALTAALVSTVTAGPQQLSTMPPMSSPQMLQQQQQQQQHRNNFNSIQSNLSRMMGSCDPTQLTATGAVVNSVVNASGNVSTKDSPSKRSSTRYNQQQQITSPKMHKSPGKSPRQMELLSKQNIQSNSQKSSSSSKCDNSQRQPKARAARGSNNGGSGSGRVRGRGRGRGSGRVAAMSQMSTSIDFDPNPLGSITNNLAGTVYDLDFDEDFGTSCSVENLKSLRDRRRSFDCRVANQHHHHHTPDQKFSSPTYHQHHHQNKLRNSGTGNGGGSSRGTTGGLLDLKPPSVHDTTDQSAMHSSHSLLHNIVHPVLPGPVDMRTYSSGYENQSSTASQEAYNSHLLGAFATGTADQTLHEIDEEVEKDFQAQLKASGTSSSSSKPPQPVNAEVVPELQVSMETTSEEISIDSDTTNTKVSLSDSRNQLKLKIKGPLAHPDIYNSSAGNSINQSMSSQNLSLQMPSASQGSANNTTGTSSLRRMRKKELLRQYWTQDMNMDDSACLPSAESKTNNDHHQAINRSVGIPKAVDSMSSIPTKDDYKDYTVMDPRKRKKSSGIARELRQLDMPYDHHSDHRPERRRSACSTGSNMSSSQMVGDSGKISSKRRGKSKTTNDLGNTNETVAPPTSLKIKIRNNTIETASSVSSDIGKRVMGCPPKKRLAANLSNVPTFEILKRDCMNFRKQVMADFDEEEKTKKIKIKTKKDHHHKSSSSSTSTSSSHHKKRKKEKQHDGEIQVIENSSVDTPKIIIRFGKRKAQGDIISDNETAGGSGVSGNLSLVTPSATITSASASRLSTEGLSNASNSGHIINQNHSVEENKSIITPIRLKIARTSGGDGYNIIGDRSKKSNELRRRKISNSGGGGEKEIPIKNNATLTTSNAVTACFDELENLNTTTATSLSEQINTTVTTHNKISSVPSTFIAASSIESSTVALASVTATLTESTSTSTTVLSPSSSISAAANVNDNNTISVQQQQHQNSNDLKGQNNKSPKGCPLLPLHKDCEVR